MRDLLAKPTTGLTLIKPAAPTAAEMIAEVAVDAPQGIPPRDILEQIIGDARVVLIGESSHGTHEFYEARSEITKWLIEEKGFCAVAAEADWPDAYRVNRYARGLGKDTTAEQALSGFERFPGWMWRNTVCRDFADWLREHNRSAQRQAGFYGLDLYSLHRSMHEVIKYLDTVDSAAAARARVRYACFDHPAGDDGQAYGYQAAFGAGPKCEHQAIEQLVELQRNSSTTYAPTACSPRTNCSTPSRTRRRSATPRSTTARCSAAGSPRGICGTSTWRRPWKHC